MLRTYLEWLAEFPWKDAPAKEIDIAQARKRAQLERGRQKRTAKS